MSNEDVAVEQLEVDSPDDIAVTNRRKTDRRVGGDRRKKQIPVAVDRRKPDSDRRVGERRRQIDPTTCERDYNNEELDFMRAIEEYKRDYRRPFPTWSEVLEVVKAMGYRRVADPIKIETNRAKAQISDDAL